MSRFLPLYLVLLTLVGWRTWSNGWASTGQGTSGSGEASSTDLVHGSEQVGVISGKPRIDVDRTPTRNDPFKLVTVVSSLEVALGSTPLDTCQDAASTLTLAARRVGASQPIRAPPSSGA